MDTEQPPLTPLTRAAPEGEGNASKCRPPLGDVLYMTWKSEGGLETSHWRVVGLSVPGADEECPITQEPMATYDLEFLPGVTFRKEEPHYRRMQLECGHAFSAMALTYHFFKNGMLCPLCRSGSDERLSVACVPNHFRKNMQKRLAVERTQVLYDLCMRA